MGNLELRKALDIVGTGSNTGAKLIPEIVSAGIREFFPIDTPLYNLVTKEDWATNIYKYRLQTAVPGAVSKADGANLPAANESTYDWKTVDMKYFYTVGTISEPLQYAVQNVSNLWEREIESHTIGFYRTIETAMVAGDSGTTATDFDGLKTFIPSDSTNGINASSGKLTLAMVENAIDLKSQRPTHILVNKVQERRLSSILQAAQRFNTDGKIEVAGGFRANSYDGLPILPLDNDMKVSGTHVLASTILFPNFDQIKLMVHRPMTFEPLYKTTGGKDEESFLLKWYGALVVEGLSRFHTKIYGLVTSY